MANGPIFPVTPQQVVQVIPPASASWCTKLLALPMRLAFLALDATKFMVNADGTVTDEFKLWMGLEVGAVATIPRNLVASNGTSTDFVRLDWSPVANAQRYDILRSETITAPTVVLATAPPDASPSFEDTTAVPGTKYSYWVRAVVNGVSSELSEPDEGYRGESSTGGGNQLSVSGGLPGVHTVEQGLIYTLIACGGGAGGGPWVSWQGVEYAGGGGGGGGYVEAQFQMEVGDVLSLQSGVSGAAGAAGGQSFIEMRRGGVTTRLVTAFSGSISVPGPAAIGGDGGGFDLGGAPITPLTVMGGKGGFGNPSSPGGAGGQTGGQSLTGIGAGGAGDSARDMVPRTFAQAGQPGQCIIRW